MVRFCLCQWEGILCSVCSLATSSEEVSVLAGAQPRGLNILSDREFYVYRCCCRRGACTGLPWGKIFTRELVSICTCVCV